MLLKIGTTDLTDIVEYRVLNKDVTKEVKSTSGYRTIYVLRENVSTILVKFGALSQDKMNILLGAISNISFDVTFVDNDGVIKTKKMSRSDRDNPLRSFIDEEAFWDESDLTLTEL